MKSKMKQILAATVISCLSTISASAAEVIWTRTVTVNKIVDMPKAVGLAMQFRAAGLKYGVDLKISMPVSGNATQIRFTRTGTDITSMRVSGAPFSQSDEWKALMMETEGLVSAPVDEWWQQPHD